jgi:hypothetical protein
MWRCTGSASLARARGFACSEGWPVKGTQFVAELRYKQLEERQDLQLSDISFKLECLCFSSTAEVLVQLSLQDCRMC